MVCLHHLFTFSPEPAGKGWTLQDCLVTSVHDLHYLSRLANTAYDAASATCWLLLFIQSNLFTHAHFQLLIWPLCWRASSSLFYICAYVYWVNAMDGFNTVWFISVGYIYTGAVPRLTEIVCAPLSYNWLNVGGNYRENELLLCISWLAVCYLPRYTVDINSAVYLPKKYTVNIKCMSAVRLLLGTRQRRPTAERPVMSSSRPVYGKGGPRQIFEYFRTLRMCLVVWGNSEILTSSHLFSLLGVW
jgi:hypothetical protein